MSADMCARPAQHDGSDMPASSAGRGEPSAGADTALPSNNQAAPLPRATLFQCILTACITVALHGAVWLLSSKGFVTHILANSLALFLSTYLPHALSSGVGMFSNLFILWVYAGTLETASTGITNAVLLLFVLIPLGSIMAGPLSAAEAETYGKRLSIPARILFRLSPVVNVVISCIMIVLYATRLPGRGLAHAAGSGLAVSFYTGSIGMAAAHELTHRYTITEQLFADIFLSFVSYAHFSLEHVYGHHNTVATAEDPVTAPCGMSLWQFVPRAYIGEWLHCIRLMPLHPQRAYMVVVSCFLTLSMLIWLWRLAGAAGIAFYLAHSAGVIALFQTINYIEHYGLEREPGQAVSASHSWDGDLRITNFALFKLEMHSAHHDSMGKRYEDLTPTRGGPRLPFGYAGMVCLAIVPPLFRAVLHPRLRKFRAQFPEQKWRNPCT